MLKIYVFAVAALCCLYANSATGLGIGVGVPVQHGYYIPAANLTQVSSGSAVHQQQYPLYPQQHLHNAPVAGNAGSYGWANPHVNRQAVNNVSSGTGTSHDWVIGSRAHGDTLLFKTIITKSVGFLRSMAEKNIIFPDPNSKQRISRITNIVVQDNSKKGTGGHSQIVNGGIGKSFVEMRFKSSNGKKIDLSLSIYGME